MKTSDFDYELPEELIAQSPPTKRDGARMMVLHRDTQTLEHRRFTDIADYLNPGDLLVTNNTRVIPARVFGKKTKEGSGGWVEFLFLEEYQPGCWDVLMRSRRRPKPGDRIQLDGAEASVTLLEDGEMGRAKVRLESNRPWLEILDAIGQTPLPPYIHRKETTDAQIADDKTRYQTIFAQNPGAVAAPTAGLHFTDDILAGLDAKGIDRATVTLHVGIGTFRPVSVDTITDHQMDFERWTLSDDTAQKINHTRQQHNRIVAVGTTSVRTLESAAAQPGGLCAGSGRTNLFIYPPYTFKAVDAMLTNFHLPKSTLIMMISAFAGMDFVREAYRTAIQERYRFYSYGDCMLIL